MVESTGPPPSESISTQRPLLVIVEGHNDFEFILRLAARLRIELPELPDVRALCAEGQMAVVLLGGGSPATWPHRVAALGCREFHLYDREQEPETQERILALERLEARPGCRGVITTKRSLENYLHPQAIVAAGGGAVEFGDHDSVARLLAQQRSSLATTDWNTLPFRSQRRAIAKAKRWLNTVAVEQMTLTLLAERDPTGELLGWFYMLQQLLARKLAPPA